MAKAISDNFLQDEYGLTKRAVFGSRSATPEDIELWVGRSHLVDTCAKVLAKAKHTPKTNFLCFIIGDYGRGKTLSLLKLSEDAKKQGLCPVYLSFKSPTRVREPGLDTIQRIFRDFNFNSVTPDKTKIGLLKQVYPDVGSIYDKIFGMSQRSLFSGVSLNSEQRLALDFLRGHISPTQKQLEKLGVICKLDSIEIAKQYLIGLLYILSSAGFPTIVLAIDEFEYVFSIASKYHRAHYFALLRELFDLHVSVPEGIRDKVSNMAIFVAISEFAWIELLDEKKSGGAGSPINPLLERVSEKIILGGLTKKETKQLIEKRLRFNRGKNKYEDKPLIPYTDDFVDYIFTITRGVPRFIIENCDHVLDKGLEERVPRLNSEFAKQVLEKRGFKSS